MALDKSRLGTDADCVRFTVLSSNRPNDILTALMTYGYRLSRIEPSYSIRTKSVIQARQVIENKAWLPGMDSNHDSRLQRPLSYH